jgi:ABC-type glycerol-3-phosphate transport system substrate-binding protein
MKRQLFSALGLVMVLSFALGACASPTPQTIVVTAPPVQVTVPPVQVTSPPQVITQIVAGTPQTIQVTTTPAPTVNPYNDTAPITVWIDAVRKPMADLWAKTHPDQASLVKFELVDRGQFPSKVLLFNNSGAGWPDAIFAEPSIVQHVADAAHDYPMDLTPWVDAKVVSQFVLGSLDPCYSPDKKLLCLRNDLAPNVLWYDKTQMDQFGYTVPTTWEEFQALGDKVVKEHPGYILGTAHNEPTEYMWASGCPVAQPLSVSKVVINATDPKCVRVAQLVDHMTANGSLSKYDPFDPKYIALGNQNKILLDICAAWCGDYVFNGTYYKTLDNRLAAALPPKWAADDKAYTGNWGGSAWSVSKHTLNPKLAVSIAVYMTTDIDVTQIVGTMPAYGPAADAWAKKLDSSKVYASSPYAVMKQAVGMVNPNYTDVVRYDLIAGFKPFITAVEQGKPTEPTLAEVQKVLTDLAQKEGYEVVAAP